jgi:prophage endopeptidase
MTLLNPYVWLGIALACLLSFFGGCSVQKGRDQDQFDAHLAADKAATDAFNAETVQKDAAQAEAIAQIGFRYEREKADALEAQDSVIADLRAGTVRLRDRFRTCPGVPKAAAGTGVDPGEADAGFNQTDAETAFGIAGDGDTGIVQLTACQAILTKERE